MKDWMTLATDFLGSGKKEAEIRDVSELPTKLTQPQPAGGQPLAEVVTTQKIDPPEPLTKPTKPSSGGVVSVLSVLSQRDEFDDRVLCTDCRNYRYGHCDQHIRAGIGISSQVGDLAYLPQRCPAFERKG